MRAERRSVDGGERKRAPRNGSPDGRGGPARQRQGGAEARETEQGQSRRRWDDRGRTAGVPGGTLGGDPRAARRGDLPAEAGEAAGNPEERWRGPRARDPDGARPVRPAGHLAGASAEV